MITRLPPLLLPMLLSGALGHSAAGVFRGESPVDPPVIEAWDGPSNYSAELADLSLTDMRASELDSEDDSATAGRPRTGAPRATPLTLEQVMGGLRSLDDAPPGEATDRSERSLVERWAELGPAAYAAEAFKRGGSERLLRQAAEA